MSIERWDQFRELRGVEGNLDRLWRGFGTRREANAWAVPLDVVRDGDNIVVQASVPGVKPGDIQVAIEDGVLTIKAEADAEHKESNGDYLLHERRTGTFNRALRLPNTVDAEKAESRYENGVLSVTLPKVESKKAKQLEVQTV